MPFACIESRRAEGLGKARVRLHASAARRPAVPGGNDVNPEDVGHSKGKILFPFHLSSPPCCPGRRSETHITARRCPHTTEPSRHLLAARWLLLVSPCGPRFGGISPAACPAAGGPSRWPQLNLGAMARRFVGTISDDLHALERATRRVNCFSAQPAGQ